MEELRIDLTPGIPNREVVGDLILDIFGRTSHPFGRYDLLIIADVGNRVYRNRIAGNDPSVPVKWRSRDAPYDYQH